MTKPAISLVVCAYNMDRELPRTLRSLSPLMQRTIREPEYEVIVVDNGSSRPITDADCRKFGANVRRIRIDNALPSPALAMNRGINAARAPLIGAMIDGARLASPRLLACATWAARLSRRAVVITLGFHLGTKVQMESVLNGYDTEAEDKLLEATAWTRDGYRLFDISVFAGSSARGWFQPITESNALFMHRTLWNELGGFDQAFSLSGGGLVNLDLFRRALSLPDSLPVTLLGEGTFHQVHGGVATNARSDVLDRFEREYRTIRGQSYSAPAYNSLYLGRMDEAAARSICRSIETFVASNDD